MRRAGFCGRQSGGPWAAMLAMLAAGVLVTGCYSPDLSGEGLFSCRDGKCPDGFECNASKQCVKPGTPDGRCKLGGPIGLADDIQSSMDIVVDGVAGALHVSYIQTVGQKGVVWLSTRALSAAVDDWADDRLGEQDQDQKLSYTAVDAQDGSIAVVFNDSETSSGPGERRRLKLTAPGRNPQVLAFEGGGDREVVGGDHITVKIANNGQNVLIVRQVGPGGDRLAVPRMLRADLGSAVVLTDEGVIDAGQPFLPITGIRNRLAVGPDGLTLAYFGQGEPQGVAGLPAQPVLVNLQDVADNPSFTRLADPILDLGAAFQRVGLAEDGGGIHLVWPEEREAQGTPYLGLMYRDPRNNVTEVRPGGQPAKAGGPVIAAWEQALGVTYVLGETYQDPALSAGPLGFTVHQASRPGEWTPQQVFEDTVADSENVLDVRMAASQGAGAVLFHVVYTTKSQQLRYRQIECAN